jgi:hypothetical protein
MFRQRYRPSLAPKRTTTKRQVYCLFPDFNDSIFKADDGRYVGRNMQLLNKNTCILDLPINAVLNTFVKTTRRILLRQFCYKAIARFLKPRVIENHGFTTTVYLLTLYSRVLLEKSTSLFSKSRNSPHFYGTVRFFTVLTSAHHLSLS